MEEYKELKLEPPEEKKVEEEKKEEKKATEKDWKKVIVDDLNKEPTDNKSSGEAICDIPGFQGEFNRHRFVIAFAITRIYTRILGHLKSNCILLLTSRLPPILVYTFTYYT